MKELSIEEKAKAYDEAIKYGQYLINKYCKKGTDGSFHCSDLQKMFPELNKESEDERIFEEIYKDLHTYYMMQRDKFVLTDIKEIWDDKWSKAKAWLEKQGEQKPANKIEPKFKVGQTIKKEGFNLGFTIVKIEDGFYYNDMGDYFPFTDQDKWELVEQKPAWSEEDEDNFKHVLDEIVCLGNNRNSANRLYYDRLIKFIKELKNRAQPKEKWCDKDERMLDRLIAYFEKQVAFTDDDNPRYANWLKFLKDRCTWTPSEEQIKALEFVIKSIDNMLGAIGHIDNFTKPRLEEILEALKKLREE